MKKLSILIMLCFSSATFASPVDACLYRVDQSISSASNRAAANGLSGSSVAIEIAMTIAMSKVHCYEKTDQATACRIMLSAMVQAGKNAAISGGAKRSDSSLMPQAKLISGC